MSHLAAAAVSAALIPSPADSARVAAQVYTVSLAAVLPVALAALVVLLLRRATAGTRALVWRAATAALAIVVAGQLLSLHSLTTAVPHFLVAPLVALGTLQLTSATSPELVAGAASSGAATLVRALLTIVATGAVLRALQLAVASLAIRRVVAGGAAVTDPEWRHALAEAQRTIGMDREVGLRSAAVAVPMTCGLRSPTILLPPRALGAPPSERRAILLHELAHVQGGDLAFAALARCLTTVLWFHPAAWWLARSLRDACERAADDRVLAAGVRTSDYAELLVGMLATGSGQRASLPALALDGHTGIRGRLIAIVDTTRDLRPPSRAAVACALSLATAIATPVASARLAPTRDVLQAMMHDVRWESRAYAVIGLAQRPDSVDVARAAAERDPSPRVRAWARLALSGAPVDSTRVPRVAPTLLERASRT